MGVRGAMKIRLAAGAAVLGVAVATAGCGSGGPATSTADGKIRVVATTNVWGSVASAVAGDLAEVTSIMSDPAGDPHSYQLTPRDAATLANAQLLLFNGGGYDEFVEQALGEGGEGPRVVQAFELLAAKGTEHNEHVWYSLATVGAVADEVARQLGEIRPESRAAFTAGARSFKDGLAGLTGRVEQVRQTHHGVTIVATEPLAHYLLTDAGLNDITPAQFVEAVEEETDPPAGAVAEIQSLLTRHQVTLVVHNPQTETPVVADVLTKAREAQLPVVDLTETLPAGQDYLTWMTEQVEELSAAVSQR
jgi:zinc/manganese transport system substrate-binding protein